MKVKINNTNQHLLLILTAVNRGSLNHHDNPMGQYRYYHHFLEEETGAEACK